MKTGLFAVVAIILGFSGLVRAQCAKPEMLAVWDDKARDFKCVMPGGGKLPEDHGKPGTTFEPGASHKEFCDVAYANLVKVCPQGPNGEMCRTKAESIHKRCAEGSSGNGSKDSSANSGNSVFPIKTSAQDCSATYAARVKICQDTKRPIRVDNTTYRSKCLAEAANDRDVCLSYSK